MAAVDACAESCVAAHEALARARHSIEALYLCLHSWRRSKYSASDDFSTSELLESPTTALHVAAEILGTVPADATGAAVVALPSEFLTGTVSACDADAEIARVLRVVQEALSRQGFPAPAAAVGCALVALKHADCGGYCCLDWQRYVVPLGGAKRNTDEAGDVVCNACGRDGDEDEEEEEEEGESV